MTTDFSTWNGRDDRWIMEPERVDEVTCIGCNIEIERLRHIKAERQRQQTKGSK